MLFPRNGRRRGGRWLAALAARGRLDGIGPGVVSPGMGLAGARLLDALERRERREPSSCPPGRFMLWMSGWGSSLPPEFSAAPAGARDRDRSRRPGRPGRPAATVLVLGLLLLGAAAAEAQTSRILVSNVSQAADDVANTSGNDHAQLFHTGNHTDGYTLTSVIVVSQDAEGDAFDVDICTTDGTSDEFPTSTCTALDAPMSFAAGNLEFTGNLRLSANTNYVVVVKPRAGVNVAIDSTTSGGEDSTGIDTMWSIKGYFYWNNSGVWTRSSTNEVLQITVNGYEVVTTPDVSSIEFTTTPSSTTYGYNIHETIPTTVTFSAAVDITGTPQLELDFAGTAKAADCTAATNTTTMVCTYKVVENDSAPNGIAIAANKLTLNGGTITASGTTTINADLDHGAVAIDAGQKVEGIRPTLVTTGSDAPTTSTDGTKVILTFSEIIRALELAKITIMVNSVTAATSAARATGTKVEIDLTTALTTTSTTLTVELAVDAVVDNVFNGNLAVAATAVTNAVVSTTTPTVTGVALTSDPSSATYGYNIGGVIEATVTFSEAVDITGTPQLELDFAGTAKAAACTAATNTTTMVCSYTVAVGDVAAGGVAIAANKLTGGTITATGSTTLTADLDHAAVAIDAGQKVDGIRPTLVTTGSNAPTTSTDGTQVILTFSETLTGVNRFNITIMVGTNTLSTSAARTVGTAVELDLSTVIDATVMLTVELATSAVFDGAGNFNLAVAATAVTNAITANASPAFSAATATRSVPENSPASTHVGAPVTATDGDNDPLTYTLEGTAAAAFEIVSASGQIRTTAGETYDRETQSSYTVTLKADDGNGGSDTIAVTITLTNVIEPPDRPAAPSVTATAGTTDSLSVNWTAPSNTGPAIDNYDLRYREGTGGSWTNGPQNVSGTSATIGSLTTSTSYQVQVLATNAEGDSPWSLPGSGQTGALGAPDVPHSLSATRGNRQVMLSWVQPSGGAEVTGYEYEQDESGTWISTGSTDTDYTVRNLTNGQPYTFKVRAANSAGRSAASAASASVTPATVPGAPTNLGVTANDQEVELSWTAPASNGGQSITDYEYEQGGSGTWISTGGTDTDYTVFNLTNGQPYRFRVRALNSVGAGAPSAASANVTPATEPDAPTNLSATVSDRSVDLIWTAPASNGGATILRYEYELDFSGAWISTGGTATSTTVRNLTNGQFYDFRVRALNSVGAGQASGSESATPTATLVAPDAPFGLSATPGNRQVTLSWVQPSGGAALTHYEYEQDNSGTWISTGSTATSTTVTGLDNGQTYTFRVRAVNAQGNGAVVTLEATPSPSTGSGGGGGGGGGTDDGPREPRPDALQSLSFTPGDGEVTLTWEAPEDDGGDPITDYEYRINGQGEWISTGSTDTTHTVTGLDNGTEYTFEVRAVNRNRKGRASNRVEATPRMPVALDFTHFANGAGTTSGLVFVNLSTQPTQPTLYFYDQEGQLIDPESVVDVTGDLMVTEDGALTVRTAMEPLGELTIRTHGRGELVSGSVKVVADGPIGGGLRFDIPGLGAGGVGTSPPLSDALFPARRQAAGIRTAAALHNLEAEAMGVSCHLMSGGVALEEVAIPLEANGQTSWFIDDTFTTTDTSDFAGAVRCTASGAGRFTAIAAELDAAGGIFTTVPVLAVNRGRAGATTLDFAHFANGTWITDLVFVNLETRQSGPPLTPFHTAIPPTRHAIYFYDTEGNPIAAASVVDVTGDLEVTDDGALTVQTAMEPLEVLTISTHGRGDLVSGSVRVVSEGPIGGDMGAAGPGCPLDPRAALHSLSPGRAPRIPVLGVVQGHVHLHPLWRDRGGVDAGVPRGQHGLDRGHYQWSPAR